MTRTVRGLGLPEALAEVGNAATVLVGLDFDGVLAPLVDDPQASRPIPGAIPAIHALDARPATTVVLVSGRDLDTLARLSGVDGTIVLIGSHGAQRSDTDPGAGLGPDEVARMARLRHDVDALLTLYPSIRLEVKPLSLVLHTRGVDAASSSAALTAARQMLVHHSQVHLTPGKDVLEMSVVDAGKGPALTRLAGEVGADMVVYFGDDVTDERAFACLHEEFGPRAVTVKVGAGPTAADHRIADEHEVLAALHRLIELRAAD